MPEKENSEKIAIWIMDEGAEALRQHKDIGWNPYTDQNRESWPHQEASDLWLEGWKKANVAQGEADSDLYTDSW